MPVLEIVRHFDREGNPIVAICHGVQLLAAADVLRGRECTGYPACAPEAKAAGATWVEVPVDGVHVDSALVTAPAWPAQPSCLAGLLAVMGMPIAQPHAAAT